MRLAILSDVHANLEALTAVIQDIEKSSVEKVIFLGDAVGYGADPNDCVRLIGDLCDIKLLGNHDYVAMGLESPRHFNLMAKQSIVWTQKTLKRKSVERLSDFEMEATFLDYHLTHATPDSPADWNYLFTAEDAERNFEAFAQSVCFVGHSHLPGVFCRRSDGAVTELSAQAFAAEPACRYIINVGSVGQPRDGNHHACYVIADTDGNRFEYRRLPYDLTAAQRKMREAQLPEFLITRLSSGK
jgi:diadenosine tetraphosphatase ApaH/serine/threonine PP2A family protein phosphatase